MALSSALRSERLKRLHSRFLEAGERFPTLCHAAVRAQHPDDWRRILPSYFYQGEIDDADRHNKENNDFLRGLVQQTDVFGHSVRDVHACPHRLTFDSLNWVGFYLPYDVGVDDFERLGADALAAFPRSDNSRWSNEWLEGQTPKWLETVYETLQEPPEILGPTPGLDGGPVGEVTIASLRSNVFVASAKAIELLAESAGKTVSPPKTGTSTDARDRWIYEQALKMEPWKAIRAALQKKCQTSDWFPIGTDTGVRDRAIAYAKRSNLPEPPRRQERSV